MFQYTDSTHIGFIPKLFRNTKYGVYWYHYCHYSFGFTQHNKIKLNDADSMDDYGEYRLSWRVNGSGGYRLGNNKKLTKSDQYYKVIFWKKINPIKLKQKLLE